MTLVPFRAEAGVLESPAGVPMGQPQDASSTYLTAYRSPTATSGRDRSPVLAIWMMNLDSTRLAHWSRGRVRPHSPSDVLESRSLAKLEL